MIRPITRPKRATAIPQTDDELNRIIHMLKNSGFEEERRAKYMLDSANTDLPKLQ